MTEHLVYPELTNSTSFCTSFMKRSNILKCKEIIAFQSSLYYSLTLGNNIVLSNGTKVFYLTNLYNNSTRTNFYFLSDCYSSTSKKDELKEYTLMQQKKEVKR